MNIAKVRVGADINFTIDLTEEAQKVHDKYGIEVTEEEEQRIVNEEMEKSGLNDVLVNIGKRVGESYSAVFQDRVKGLI